MYILAAFLLAPPNKVALCGDARLESCANRPTNSNELGILKQAVNRRLDRPHQLVTGANEKSVNPGLYLPGE